MLRSLKQLLLLLLDVVEAMRGEQLETAVLQQPPFVEAGRRQVVPDVLLVGRPGRLRPHQALPLNLHHRLLG